jgi:hypothetical protein
MCHIISNNLFRSAFERESVSCPWKYAEKRPSFSENDKSTNVTHDLSNSTRRTRLVKLLGIIRGARLQCRRTFKTVEHAELTRENLRGHRHAELCGSAPNNAGHRTINRAGISIFRKISLRISGFGRSETTGGVQAASTRASITSWNESVNPFFGVPGETPYS